MRLASKASYLIAITGVIALTACAAYARPRQHNHHRHSPYAYDYNYAFPGDILFRGSNGYRSNNQRRSYDVYDIRGHYIGSDPDPTVRSQLSHDPGQGRD